MRSPGPHPAGGDGRPRRDDGDGPADRDGPMGDADGPGADGGADAAACAALLHAAQAWDGLAVAVTLLGAALSAWPAPRPGAFALLMLLAAAERFLALRLRLDARLFDRLAADGGVGADALARLDGALHRVLAVSVAKAGRPLAPRIAGARRLVAWHLAAFALLVVFDLATIAFSEPR